MTFDLNVSEINSSSQENLSEDSKVEFNLEEDSDAVELSLNEISNTVVKSVQEDDNVINDSSVPSEVNHSNRTDISLKLIPIIRKTKRKYLLILLKVIPKKMMNHIKR